MTGGSVRREWVVCRRAPVTSPLAAGGPAQTENPAGFPAEPAAGRTLMKVTVFPFANVHTLVKAKVFSSLDSFYSGQRSCFKCFLWRDYGITSYYVSVKISLVRGITN